ncbi:MULTISPECIES: hypothetical protein [Methylobacterium]|uniref:hypothetical protein n=1 Tax=Methylobacterium TaxID=407 RepID=UPI000C3CB471|nr:hypothetical protein [Methylobacterium sp.]MBP28317.1 hypothetical protein [Methylobacterium sp.]MDH3030035.1 hypothetical protein [Methylobacterium fujisawaense]RUP16215.1 MAG: hypothetical protein EKK43_02955 [Methylobacterium sp.]
MSIRNGLVALVLAAVGIVPASAWAWGVPGCTNLPEYNRALGALQGMTSACDMSVEEARRIVAAHDGVAPGPPAAAAEPQAMPRVAPRHRRARARAHRSARPQPRR